MKNFRPYMQRFLFPLILLVVLSSCKEDDPSPQNNTDKAANIHVNSWILENMKYWYLWSNDMNEGTDNTQAPDAYFDALLAPNDRFSWIQDNYQELLNSLKGINKEAGFEFILYKDKTNPDNVIAQVVYVKENSPAATAGLIRGDVITHLNNKQITVANYKELLAEMDEPYSIRYKSSDVESETFSEEKTITLSPVEFSENPNFMYKIIDANDRKIGYYVYNFFASGPNNDSHVYDEEMDQIFGDFKAQGITDLVLDLRFNSGGSEGAAVNLASLIGPGVNDTKVLARKEYNEGVTEVILNDPELGEDFLTRKFNTKSQNLGDQLHDNRVYILTSSRSASASELVINALKPYMDVFIIGDTTYGKNVGSISLFDEEDTKNTWGMQPIVVKIYNSLDQSDYADGFTPNVTQKDNSLFVYPLGDEREVLLGHAIGQITGTSTSGRVKQTNHQAIGHSLDSKRRSFNLIVDFPQK
jgi:carboxyl-terminal processing protease